MSFRRNSIANYTGRFYTILIGIFMLPLYFKYLGAAAFGLVGLFTVIQGCLSLFDIGMTPALAREVAIAKSNSTNNFLKVKHLVRNFEIIFTVFTLISVTLTIILRHWISINWLKIDGISHTQVVYCLTLMGIMASLRWFTDLYRAGLQGLEHQVWLNGATIVLLTLQYGGGYILLRWVTPLPSHFFEYQLVITMLNPVIFGKKFYALLNWTPISSLTFRFDWASVKSVLPFATSAAYTSLIWVCATQLDKVILSHTLPLTQYGYFALVTIAVNGMMQFSGPITQALLPRITALWAQGKIPTLIELYRNATQLTAVVMLPLAGIIAVFSNIVLYSWTGNENLTAWGTPVLFWYGIGCGISSMSAFQYVVQYAAGQLKWHVWFNTFFAIIIIPITFIAAYYDGARGTAIAWCVLQALAFVIWPAVIHHKFLPGVHRTWLVKDILPIALTVIIVVLVLHQIPLNVKVLSREGCAMLLSLFGAITVTAAVCASSTCRNTLIPLFRKQTRLNG